MSTTAAQTEASPDVRTRLRRARTYATAVPGRFWWPDTRFFIFSRGRAGSTLLRTLLESHPDVYCDGEILQHRLLFPMAFVDGRCAAAGRSGVSVYGFKILTHHLKRDRSIADPRPFIGRLRKRGYRAIRVTRTDPLRGALSWQNALQKGFGQYESKGKQAFEAITVDPAIILRWLDDTKPYDDYEELALSEIETLTLTYETDLEDPARQQETIDLVCDWLGVGRGVVASELLKQVPHRSVPELVANYDELAEALRGTPHEHLLH